MIEYFFNEKIDKTDFMFYDCDLTYINLSNFNTENVTNMSHMFQYCKNL